MQKASKIVLFYDPNPNRNLKIYNMPKLLPNPQTVTKKYIDTLANVPLSGIKSLFVQSTPTKKKKAKKKK
jgi:hypothetical protein